ncbi:hypothetical protein [Streptomyces sp. NPDC008001]
MDVTEALRATVERARTPKDTGETAATGAARAARGEKKTGAKT